MILHISRIRFCPFYTTWQVASGILFTEKQYKLCDLVKEHKVEASFFPKRALIVLL